MPPFNTIDHLDFVAGTTLLVDKPMNWTSFDVVNKIRYCLKRRLGIKKIKVGHAGTLDPMATGLLLICTGKFTKKLQDFQNLAKAYEGTMRLGAITPSYDAETAISQHFPTDHITPKQLELARQQFIGPIDQLPPMYSAIKVDGQPLYKKARKGITLELKTRPVHIYDFILENSELPDLDFRVKCSKGTYIRSLAHDFGKALQSGAYLTRLCRSKIGSYSLTEAWNLQDLVKALDGGLNEF